jgi:hypothetical protein
MRSFRLEKVRGDQDVTHEALIWLVVLLFIVGPLLAIVWYIAS